MTATQYPMLPYHRPGQVVEATRTGTLLRIVSVGPKNAVVEDEIGKRWRYDRRTLRETDREFTSTAPEAPPVQVGTVVTMKPEAYDPKFGYEPDTYFVVVALPNNGRVKLVKLGGSDRYLVVHDINIEVPDKVEYISHRG
jgi:hypothetical protein